MGVTAPPLYKPEADLDIVKRYKTLTDEERILEQRRSEDLAKRIKQARKGNQKAWGTPNDPKTGVLKRPCTNAAAIEAAFRECTGYCSPTSPKKSTAAWGGGSAADEPLQIPLWDGDAEKQTWITTKTLAVSPSASPVGRGAARSSFGTTTGTLRKGSNVAGANTAITPVRPESAPPGGRARKATASLSSTSDTTSSPDQKTTEVERLSRELAITQETAAQLRQENDRLKEVGGQRETGKSGGPLPLQESDLQLMMEQLRHEKQSMETRCHRLDQRCRQLEDAVRKANHAVATTLSPVGSFGKSQSSGGGGGSGGGAGGRADGMLSTEHSLATPRPETEDDDDSDYDDDGDDGGGDEDGEGELLDNVGIEDDDIFLAAAAGGGDMAMPSFGGDGCHDDDYNDDGGSNDNSDDDSGADAAGGGVDRGGGGNSATRDPTKSAASPTVWSRGSHHSYASPLSPHSSSSSGSSFTSPHTSGPVPVYGTNQVNDNDDDQIADRLGDSGGGGGGRRRKGSGSRNKGGSRDNTLMAVSMAAAEKKVRRMEEEREKKKKEEEFMLQERERKLKLSKSAAPPAGVLKKAREAELRRKEREELRQAEELEVLHSMSTQFKAKPVRLDGTATRTLKEIEEENERRRKERRAERAAEMAMRSSLPRRMAQHEAAKAARIAAAAAGGSGGGGSTARGREAGGADSTRSPGVERKRVESPERVAERLAREQKRWDNRMASIRKSNELKKSMEGLTRPPMQAIELRQIAYELKKQAREKEKELKMQAQRKEEEEEAKRKWNRLMASRFESRGTKASQRLAETTRRKIAAAHREEKAEAKANKRREKRLKEVGVSMRHAVMEREQRRREEQGAVPLSELIVQKKEEKEQQFKERREANKSRINEALLKRPNLLERQETFSQDAKNRSSSSELRLKEKSSLSTSSSSEADKKLVRNGKEKRRGKGDDDAADVWKDRAADDDLFTEEEKLVMGIKGPKRGGETQNVYESEQSESKNADHADEQERA